MFSPDGAQQQKYLQIRSLSLTSLPPRSDQGQRVNPASNLHATKFRQCEDN